MHRGRALRASPGWGGRRWSLAAIVVLMALLMTAPASASSALELVRVARAHEVAHEEDTALRRYMEALSLDPTCDEAYLGLGALRTRRGDLREAERVYSLALEHVPELQQARRARAFVRHALGMRDQAVADLLAPTGQGTPETLRILAQWHGEDGQTPAQLAVWRRIAVLAAETNDSALAREAQLHVRALLVLVREADPAAWPADDRGDRRLFAALARRAGR
ncbi:tetratricopeptide repeat protein [Labilithrix luteola]|nr:tetratricopeptide repeat protein [Labilithrix luteola]